MNIVFVSGEFPKKPDYATGGIGTYLLTLTQELIRQGHQVTVITKNVDTHYYPYLQIINCGFNRPIKSKIILLNRLINFINYPLLFSIQVFWKLKQLKNADIIEGNDFGADLFVYLLLVKKRPPVVLRLHTPSFVIQKYNDEPETLFYKVIGFMEKFCLKKADSLYSPTRNLAEIISQDTGRKIDTIIPYPFKPPINTNPNKKKDLVLYVGRLQVKKGVFILLEAARNILANYPILKFIFVGPDTTVMGESIKLKLINKCKEYKINNRVKILPCVDKNKLFELYAQAKIVVVPSFWENFPNVVLEAWNFNALVIAAKSGGLIEMIGNDSGLLFNSGDHLELAGKISKICKNVSLQKNLIKNIPAKLKRYNHQEITRHTLYFYERVYKACQKVKVIVNEG